MISLPQNVEETSLTNLPVDLFIEILSRLPGKSIAICRCVCKLWTSILGSSDFTEAVLISSTARPQLLFVCQNKDGLLLFFTTSQPHNPDANSCPLAASSLEKVFLDNEYVFKLAISTIRGFVFFSDVRDTTGRTWIYRPSTYKMLNVPEQSDVQQMFAPQCYIGYDPTEKQFKILAITTVIYVHYNETQEVEESSNEYQVLTVRTGEKSWRKIECCIRHDPIHSGICINGVLYYPADNDRFWEPDYMVVCFDVRSEKFRFIKVTVTFIKEVLRNGILINYNGKFAALVALGSKYVNGRTKSFKLWVLEDVVKEEWSEHTYILSASCRNTFRNKCLRFVGVTRTKEIVLSSHHQNRTGPFYIYYYNIKRGTIVRVEIQGIKGFKGNKVNIYLDHVQDVKHR